MPFTPGLVSKSANIMEFNPNDGKNKGEIPTRKKIND